MYETKYLVFVLLHVLLNPGLTVAQNVETKVVNINQGPVRGYRSAQYGVFEFHGIPYASAPTGSDKFKAPLSGPVWTETFEANVTNIACPQRLTGELEALLTMDMKEDCLIANVYVPDTEETNLSVVVIVHGGAYRMGWSDLYSPVAIVAEGNYIAVTFNYRVGIHGFLCLGTEDIPGNAGMKDQVAALRWVKENIASFGGNPDDITLTGYSSGSSSAELLMLSETTHGLFNKVVLESGAAVAGWSVQLDPTEVALEFARTYLQFETDDIYDLNDLYKTTPLEDLVSNNLLHHKEDSSLLFVPCIEQDTGSDNLELFLKDAPVDIIRNGNYNQLPLLIGFTEMEGMERLDIFDEWKNKMNEQFEDFLPADLIFESVEQKVEVAQRVKRFYFGDEPVSNETIQNYIDYFGDVIFAYPTMWSVRLQVEAGNNDIYLYEYSFVDDMLQYANPYNYRGATHTAQTIALNDVGDVSTYSEEYRNMIEVIRKLWINFYKTGKPVTEPTAEFPQGWPASSANGSPHMNLDNPTILKGILWESSTKFWDEIYEQYYRKPIPPRSH